MRLAQSSFYTLFSFTMDFLFVRILKSPSPGRLDALPAQFSFPSSRKSDDRGPAHGRYFI
jgi:hypothetical protein